MDELLSLTKDEAARALNVSVWTVENITRTGQLRSVKIGKHKRWLPADLQAYIKALPNDACTPKAGA